MTSDHQITSDFIHDILNTLERHGYVRSDWLSVPTSQPTAPQQPGPPGVIVSADQVKTLLAALDDAAEYKRDRAETCADCADQSCTTCQWRLQAAATYDQMAGQMIQAAEASTARRHTPGHTAPPSAGHQVVADKEAGQ